MATFRYSARDPSGRVIAGAIQADNEVGVIGRLQEMGYYVTSVEEQRARISLGAILRQTRGIGLRDLAVFARQFATMINAGLPIVRALSVLEGQTANPKLEQVIATVRTDVQEGVALSEAMTKHPKAFSSLIVSLVRAGEVGGVLDEVLQRVASFLEKDVALRNKIRAAVTYPIAIFAFALGIIFFLVFFILPQFIGFFQGMGLVLPLPTRVLIWSTRTLTHYWYVVLAVIVGGVYFLRAYLRSPAGQATTDRLKLRVPIFGPLSHKVMIARFSRTFSTMIGSGVPVMQSLEVVGNAVGNVVLKHSIEAVRQSIREGESISLPLQASGLFPPLVVQMVSVGEETGRLDEMLTKVADFYEDEVETTLEQLTSILEPLMILFLGAIIAFIVLSFYLPLYQLVTNVKE